MPQVRTFHLYGVEKLTLFYVLITSLIIVLLGIEHKQAYELLTNRLVITLVIGLLVLVNKWRDWWTIRFMRNLFVGSLLIFWYPETYDINRMLPNFDHLLANFEQFIFSCQPAESFCLSVPQLWFSEIMNMGYFAYYPLIVCTGLFFYITDLKYFQYFYFTVLFAFFIYYLIFILFPTAGPQYYFAAIGEKNVNAGIFPSLGHYFNTNSVLIPAQETEGFFKNLVESTQQVGERPTAAFPSSHVGISTLIMLLIHRSKKYIAFFIVFPLYLALVFSTVYIQAHYAIDVIAGLISALTLYSLSNTAYKSLSHTAISYRPSRIRHNKKFSFIK